MSERASVIRLVCLGVMAGLLALWGCNGPIPPAVTQSEMHMIQGATEVPDGTGSWDFASVTAGSTSDSVFTIHNKGDAALTLTGTPPAVVSGTDAAEFSIAVQPEKTIAAGHSTTFTVRFAPSSAGTKTATVTIASNDSDKNPFDFVVTGTATAVAGPAMIVKQDTAPIADGTGNYSFTGTTVSTSTDAVFTIENAGNQDLQLTGSPVVQIGGADAGQFSVSPQPAATVAAGGSTTFTVRFSPTSPGAKAATISIANSDSERNPYDFAITGVGTVPEINIKQGSTPIADGTGSYAFAPTTVFSFLDVIFTIENTGDAPLQLTGSPLVQIGGTNPSQYSVTLQPAASVAAGNSTTFKVRFWPTSTGVKNATIIIANNDSDENPYDFAISGLGTAPEINVRQDTTAVADGGSYTFAATPVFSSTDATFTVENTGNVSLTLSGSPIVSISGTDAALFTVTSQPAASVAAGGSTTFTVHFAPTSAGVKAAALSFANNDSNENPYNFSIGGNATVAAEQEINIKAGPAPIADGTGSYSYAATMMSAFTDATFTIENSGAQDLLLSGGPLVQIGGADAAQFSVTALPTTPVTSGGTTTFTVRFTPTSLGPKTATILVANNDSDENPYDFSISATGTEWHGVKAVDTATIVGAYGTSIAASGDNIYISYYEEASMLSGSLKFASSADGGLGWSTRTLDSTQNPGKYASIAAYGSNVYISYSPSAPNVLRLAKSADYGATWTFKNVDTASSVGLFSSIVADGSGIYIAYYDSANTGVKFAKSTDGGANWSLVTVDNGGTSNVGWTVSLAVSGSNMYISYYDFTAQDLKFAASSDGGATWPIVTTLDSTGNVGYPSSIAASGSNVYISYYDTSNTDLKLAKSADGGATWPTIGTVDSLGSLGDHNCIKLVGGTLYISYEGHDTNDRLWFAKSIDGGSTWSIIKVDAANNVGDSTSIAVDGSRVFISETETNADDLKLAKSIDGGATW